MDGCPCSDIVSMGSSPVKIFPKFGDGEALLSTAILALDPHLSRCVAAGGGGSRG